MLALVQEIVKVDRAECNPMLASEARCAQVYDAIKYFD